MHLITLFPTGSITRAAPTPGLQEVPNLQLFFGFLFLASLYKKFLRR